MWQIGRDSLTEWPCVWLSIESQCARAARGGLLGDHVDDEVTRASLDDAIDELRRQVHDALADTP